MTKTQEKQIARFQKVFGVDKIYYPHDVKLRNKVFLMEDMHGDKKPHIVASSGFIVLPSDYVPNGFEFSDDADIIKMLNDYYTNLKLTRAKYIDTTVDGLPTNGVPIAYAVSREYVLDSKLVRNVLGIIKANRLFVSYDVNSPQSGVIFEKNGFIAHVLPMRK